jgi:hypothetical protein
MFSFELFFNSTPDGFESDGLEYDLPAQILTY